MSERSDLANQFMKENLAKASLAVNCLASMGLEVQEVNLSDRKPSIRILRGKGCDQLDSGLMKRFVFCDGQRRTEKVALVSGCHVSWEEEQ